MKGFVALLTTTPNPLKLWELQQEPSVLDIQCMHDVLRMPKMHEGLKFFGVFGHGRKDNALCDG